MKTKRVKLSLLLVIGLVALFVTGCDKVDVDVTKGEGYIRYEGTDYPLNSLTIITVQEGGISLHNTVMTDIENANNVFSFLIKDEKASLSAGTYPIVVQGGNTARYKLGNLSENSLEGTLTIGITEDVYTFNFTGKTAVDDQNPEAKAVTATYKGKKK